MNNLSALRERVEKAESGYPQLDLMIWNTLNKAGETWAWLNNVDGDERIVCEKMAEGSIFRPVCSVDQFSRSFEAAVGLIEAKGWRIYTLDASIEGQYHWMLKSKEPRLRLAEDECDPERMLMLHDYAGAVGSDLCLALIAALLNALETHNG